MLSVCANNPCPLTWTGFHTHAARKNGRRHVGLFLDTCRRCLCSCCSTAMTIESDLLRWYHPHRERPSSFGLDEAERNPQCCRAQLLQRLPSVPFPCRYRRRCHCRYHYRRYDLHHLYCRRRRRQRLVSIGAVWLGTVLVKAITRKESLVDQTPIGSVVWSILRWSSFVPIATNC